MQLTPLYRRWTALVLAFFFVAAWSLKTMHGFLVHADHHDRPVCMAEHDPAAQHIHDARYAPDGCTLCAFVLSIPALPSVAVWTAPAVTVPAEASPTQYLSPALPAAGSATPSRGPPVA